MNSLMNLSLTQLLVSTKKEYDKILKNGNIKFLQLL